MSQKQEKSTHCCETVAAAGILRVYVDRLGSGSVVEPSSQDIVHAGRYASC